MNVLAIVEAQVQRAELGGSQQLHGMEEEHVGVTIHRLETAPISAVSFTERMCTSRMSS